MAVGMWLCNDCNKRQLMNSIIMKSKPFSEILLMAMSWKQYVMDILVEADVLI